MKILVRISVLGFGLLALLRTAAFAGPGWFWQSPLPGGNSLSAVTVLDGNTLVAVGDVGTIIRSTDSGQTWTIQLSGTVDLRGVSFSDAQAGSAVGNSGTILISIDAGQSWTLSSSGTNADLKSVCFVGQTGTAVGRSGTILGTIDGGASWTPQSSGTSFDLYGVHCISESLVIAVGEHGTILRTYDGGGTWREQSSGMDVTLSAVAFADALVGWAVGGRNILHTDDAGATWTSRFTTSAWYESLAGISIAGDHVLAVGRGGRWGDLSFIARSTDGGQTWTSDTRPLVFPCPSAVNGLSAIALVDAQTAIAVGLGGEIHRTTDGGAFWNRQVQCAVTTNINSVSFVDAKTGWVAGDDRIAHTTDGGFTWTRQESQGTGGRAVFFADANKGWVVGYRVILHTTDGGANWARSSGGTNLLLNALSFVDTNTGWAVGGSIFDGASAIVHTTDGGATWTPQVSGPDRPLSGVSFADANLGVAVGDYSTILRTIDGGENWTNQVSWPACTECDPYHSSDNCCFLSAVSFADPDTAIAVGRSNGGAVILRTTDGGITWARQLVDTNTNNFEGVSFADASNGLVVGMRGPIFRTTDGGATWTRQESGTRRDFSSVSFVDADTATVVGNFSTILHTTTGGE